MFGLNPQQQMQQPQNMQISENMGRGFTSPENPEQLKLILDHQQILDEIDDMLRGRYYDQSSQKWIKTNNPKLNEEGICEVMQILKLRCSKVFSLSNFTLKEISIRMKTFSRELALYLYQNKKRFKLDKNEIPLLTHTISDAVEAIFKESQGDNLKKFLGKNFESREVRSFGNNNRGGLFK